MVLEGEAQEVYRSQPTTGLCFTGGPPFCVGTHPGGFVKWKHRRGLAG